MFKDSARELGTLRFFREKLQRRNVTLDVKHFEDCEQLFISIGRSYTVEALLEYFEMETLDDCPHEHLPPRPDLMPDQSSKKEYFDKTMEKFIDEFLSPVLTFDNDCRPEFDVLQNDEESCNTDFVRNYSLRLLQYFFIMADIKDAVKEGNGLRLHQIHKQLLYHFKSDSGYNASAIEMFINIIQNEVLLSKQEAHQCIWSATANWPGGKGRNIEIDLLQENRNKDLKNLIKEMGVHKTDKAIDRASRAVCGIQHIVENLNMQTSYRPTTGSHTHKASVPDELKILKDLRELRPFLIQPGRAHSSFPSISTNPLATLNTGEFKTWLLRHKKYLVHNIPSVEEANEV
jgi:hypothetical protein